MAINLASISFLLTDPATNSFPVAIGSGTARANPFEYSGYCLVLAITGLRQQQAIHIKPEYLERNKGSKNEILPGKGEGDPFRLPACCGEQGSEPHWSKGGFHGESQVRHFRRRKRDCTDSDVE